MNSPSNNKRKVSLFAAYERTEDRFSTAPKSRKEDHDFHNEQYFQCSAFCDTSDSDEVEVENPESPAPIFKIEKQM